MESSKYAKVVVPNKSPNDKRGYKAVQLNNKLQVLLVSDPQCEKSACAFSVKVGSVSDPDSSLGLAHFLEHMLFMGSQKYPSSNEYSQFISLNAGLDNAYTDDEETNYYFQIANAKFEEGVDRLSAFFKSTLLAPECVEKERQAVHEEFVLWTNDDNCKRWGVVRKLGTGEYGRFSIGNQDTLNHPQVLQDLRNFYDSYYSANLMNCALISHHPIQKMEELFIPMMEDIPNKNASVPEVRYPFDKNLGKKCRVQSIKDEDHLEFNWVIRNLKPYYETHVTSYLTHVLGHEGENSLFSHLKLNGWATELSSYTCDIPKATIVGIDITLTEEGADQVDKIYCFVTAYIKECLKPDLMVFQELLEKNRLSFEFQEKTQNYSYCSKLASRMNYIPIDHILDYKVIGKEFNPTFLQEVINELEPSKLILFVTSNQAIEGAEVETYLKTPYKLEPLPTYSRPKQKFLPLPPNPYLPVSTSLYPQELVALPVKLCENLIFAPDPRFRVCKGSITMSLNSNFDEVFQELYVAWLENMLKEKMYPAEVLGVSPDIDFRNKRINFGFFGYSNTVLKLVGKLPAMINSLFQDQAKAEKMFELELERMTQDYQNFYVESTDEVLDDHIVRLLVGKDTLSVSDILAELENYTFAQFSQHARKLWAKVHIEWVFVGNFSKQQALDCKTSFERQVGVDSAANPKPTHGCLKLTRNLAYEVPIESEDITTSGAIVYHQLGPASLADELVLEILKFYIKQPFFNELRTVRQLAYYLATFITENRGIIGLYFILVSSSIDPAAISHHIREFTKDHFAKFASLTEQQFDELKQAVYFKRTQPDQNLSDYADFIKTEVFTNRYAFNSKDKELIQAQLKAISLQQVLSTIDKLLDKTLNLLVVAKCHSAKYDQSKQTLLPKDLVLQPEFKLIKDEAEYFTENLRVFENPHTSNVANENLVKAAHLNWAKNRKQHISKTFACNRNKNSN